MSLDKETVVEYLSNLPVIELAEMISTLEEKWGVSAAAPVAVAGVAAAGGGAPAEEKTEFDVILSEIDASKKINVIKEVRAVTGLGLKEAKDLVEGAPKPVKEGVSKDEAAKIKDVLEKAGAKVTVK